MVEFRLRPLYYTNLKETTENYGGSNKPGHPGYYLKNGDKSFFIAPSWNKYSIDGNSFILEGDETCLQTLDNKLLDKSKSIFNPIISIKPYWPAYIIRFFVIFAFWILLLSSFIFKKDWINKKQ